MEQRRRQFDLEQRLAREILASTREERPEVTRIAYDRLYREAPWHPDLQATHETRMTRVRRQAGLLTMTVRRARRVIELGCGSGELLRYLAERNPRVSFTGIDISAEKLNSGERGRLPNLVYRTGDAIEPSAEEGVYDLVISSQVLEHLHPEDVPGHLRAVRRLLRPGGVFEVDTPNRYTGPHDVSRYFSDTACGSHLKEWTFVELIAALHTAGFGAVHTDIPGLAHLRRLAAIPGDLVLAPAVMKAQAERIYGPIPSRALRTKLFQAGRMGNIMLYAHAKA